MKADVKERIYLLIIIFCVAMCGAMIVSMVTGGIIDKGEEHVPVIREIEDEEDSVYSSENDGVDDGNGTASDENISSDSGLPLEDDMITETNGQIAVTEEFVNKQLSNFLPSAFPVKNTSVDIGADGIVSIRGNVNRDKLKSYLKDIGADLSLKYSVAMLMMPKDFEAEIAVSVKEGTDGKLLISLYSATLDGKDIPAEMFPQKVTDIISNAVNGLITSVGEVFEFSGFEDGAILLKKI